MLSALIVSLSIANRGPNHLEIERHSIANRITSLARSPYAREFADVHCCTMRDMASEPIDLGKSKYKLRSVPMLCPSVGDVLATPLHIKRSVVSIGTKECSICCCYNYGIVQIGYHEPPEATKHSGKQFGDINLILENVAL